ncbi:hypothetical protein LIER_27357 [Lithospermum erythrorhizon]|uniref:Reverse transcriptase domain-containing protein n=1 Tax=Lithospermum erythrorhizon TaxID=34254 RepID=A0AAV3RFN4_LITER
MGAEIILEEGLTTHRTEQHPFLHITTEEGESLPEDAVDAPLVLEEDVKITVDKLKEINLGIGDEPRPTYISALLMPEEEAGYVALLKEFKDVFAWTYKEMPGLDPKIAVHHLAVKESIKPGATYQRAMQKVFDDMLHKNVECYVVDLVVKSLKTDHPQDLRTVFERLRRYQLKMIQLKCAFGVALGKFLGFVVRRHGIEIEHAKIHAITALPEPRNLHELKSLQGKLSYLHRFISNLAGKCQSFSKLMKKGIPF